MDKGPEPLEQDPGPKDPRQRLPGFLPGAKVEGRNERGEYIRPFTLA
jgi:hypothetical protein